MESPSTKIIADFNDSFFLKMFDTVCQPSMKSRLTVVVKHLKS